MRVSFFPPTYGSGLGEQYRKTTEGLAKLGVDIAVANEGADLAGAATDVIHLFDTPDIYSACRHFVRARQTDAAVAVSPIYWNAKRFYQEGLLLADPPGGKNAALEQDLRDSAQRAEWAIQQLIFRHADILVANSDSEGELLVRDFGAERERLVIAPNGVDSIYAGASPEAFVASYGVSDFVLCAARADARKNQLSLIRALQAEAIPLVLAGGSVAPGYLELCRKEAEHSKGRVLFLPSLKREELASAYKAAKVHALVSWYDCAPLAVIEAAAAGCNSVVTTESGARDYLGEEGWYCDPGDASSIRNAVLEGWNSPRRTGLSDRLLENCTWEKSAKQTCLAYERAMGMPRVRKDESYVADLEAALDAAASLLPLHERARAELWQQKNELAQTVESRGQLTGLQALGALRRGMGL